MTIAMAAKSTPQSQTKHESTIEALAHETGLPVSHIHELYFGEHAKLDAQARIKNYLPVITRTRVREIVRKRAAHR